MAKNYIFEVSLFLRFASWWLSCNASSDFPPRSAYKYQRFTAWAKNSGAFFPKLKIGQCPVSGRRGLFASSSILPGEVAILVPASMGLFSLQAEARLGSWVSELSDVERLIALLVSEISEPRSFWRPYLEILPSLDDLDAAFLWPKNITSILKGSAALSYITYIEAGLESAAANVCSAASRSSRFALRMLACDSSLLRWAHAVVRTRSLEGSDGRGAMLLPLLDLANHAPLAPPMYLPFANGTGMAGLVTSDGVAVGGEILVRYEESSNANLLATYGFVVPANPHDCVVVLGHLPPSPGRAAISGMPARSQASSDAVEKTAGRLDDLRRQVMAAHGLFDLRHNPRTLGPDGTPSPALLRYLRLCCLPWREWDRADEVAAGAEGGTGVEVCAWRLLAQRAEQILGNYSCKATEAVARGAADEAGYGSDAGPAPVCWSDADIAGDVRMRAVQELLAGEQVSVILYRAHAARPTTQCLVVSADAPATAGHPRAGATARDTARRCDVEGY